MMQQQLFRRRQANSDDSLIPLINIVFLLLIFFMVAGKITGNQAMQVELPATASDRPAEENGLEVVLDKQGSMVVNGKPVSLEVLDATLHAALLDDPQAPVVLKVDARVLARDLTPLLKAIRAAGVVKIRLLAIREAA